MLNVLQAASHAAFLNAVAEPTRLRMIMRLMDGPRVVTALSRDLNLSLVNISHHLGILRREGLVENQRLGRRILYRLNPEIFTPSRGDDIAGSFQLGPCFIQLRRPDRLTAAPESEPLRRATPNLAAVLPVR